ncbi:hypothetical protein KKE78_01390 [Patescibacteria group bacterium]|nr:hypothetical protein [Patescibacteria group bacterium]
MFRTQIYIPETTHQQAKRLAGQLNQTLTELLRRLIITGLEEEKKKVKPKKLSSLAKLNIKSGPKDLSSKLDFYLYR